MSNPKSAIIQPRTARSRFRDALLGRPVERPAIICPGGMMSMAVRDVMIAAGETWPEAHLDSRSMAALALAMHDQTRFDNIAVPFCMTVEASLWGAEVEEGSLLVQPRVRRPILPPDGQADLPTPDLANKRVTTVLESISALRQMRPETPIIGNTAGPFSVLAELVEAMMLLRWTRRNVALAQRHMERVTDGLVEYARLQIAAGADVLCISEPTATGDIIGGQGFTEIVLPHLGRLCRAAQGLGVPVIVHICGDVTRILVQLRDLPAEVLSVDNPVDIIGLCREDNPWQVMGNLSPLLLENGSPERVAAAVRRLVDGGVRLVAPACGIVPTTPLANLQAAADEVRRTLELSKPTFM